MNAVKRNELEITYPVKCAFGALRSRISQGIRASKLTVFAKNL